MAHEVVSIFELIPHINSGTTEAMRAATGVVYLNELTQNERAG